MEKCSICYELFMKSIKVIKLKNCNHIYHRKCFDNYLAHKLVRTTADCPLCKSLI